MILDKIIETKKEEVARLKRRTSVSRLLEMSAGRGPVRNFRNALDRQTISIIAEVKCASPSRGRLVQKFDPQALARIYEANGAGAISVLTDEKYFSGHNDYLSLVKDSVGIPVLRKDFIIDPLQIYETRAIGADAVLLIVRVLGDALADFLALAGEHGLAALVEVHMERELEAALKARASLIGINNRDLDTFVTDIGTSVRLRNNVPAGCVVVAESGIRNRADIEYLQQAGIGAFLIGEGLVTAPDAGYRLRQFLGVAGDAG